MHTFLFLKCNWFKKTIVRVLSLQKEFLFYRMFHCKPHSSKRSRNRPSREKNSFPRNGGVNRLLWKTEAGNRRAVKINQLATRYLQKRVNRITDRRDGDDREPGLPLTGFVRVSTARGPSAGSCEGSEARKSGPTTTNNTVNGL